MKLFAVSLAAACLFAGAASAQEARIGFRDLDLGSPAGAEAFDARVQTATRTLCRNARRTASRLPDRDHCAAAVLAEVMRQMPARARHDYALSRLPIVTL